MQSYTTKQGDTWDTIAFDKYGDEKQCHLIMQANPEHLRQDIVIFSAGVTLAIPDSPTAEYKPVPSLFEAPKPMLDIPQSLEEIIAGTGVMISRNHGDLSGRNKPNQHAAGAILYGDKPLDTALKGIEDRMTTKPPVTQHQSTPATEWVVRHELCRKKPEYHITGTDGVEIVGAINWDEADENQFIVRFSIPVAGKVEVWV